MRIFWGGPIKEDKYDSPGSMSEAHFDDIALTDTN